MAHFQTVAMIRYSIPSQVQGSYLHNRPLLSTRQGGHVAVDATLLTLWRFADGRSLSEIVAARSQFQASYDTPRAISVAMACLAEAGLLERQPITESTPLQPLSSVASPPTAAIIVNYNSLDWLRDCIPSLLAQTRSPTQIIVVDNGSHDGALDWLAAHHPQVLCHQIDQPTPLAHAINVGVGLAAPSSHLLILNPDIRLEAGAVQHMAAVAESDPLCAAAAAKLYFSWAPPFLNGLGNQVGPLSWGTDNALGHLDIGQFDDMNELPSACFAAALIPWEAWQAVGPLDEDFPMYYEDVEWCYRARLLGFKVLAAPQAVIHHAFGGTGGPTGQSEGLSPSKLANVVYGRLRFVLKLLKQRRALFLRNYLAEDLLSFIRYLSTGKWAMARAYLVGWSNLLRSLPKLLKQRRFLQPRRKLKDDKLFAIQGEFPMPLSWSGLPELTWDLVLHTYAPLIYSERSRPLPEFSPHSRRLHLLIVCPPVTESTITTQASHQYYQEMAQTLSQNMDVTLATCGQPTAETLHISRHPRQRSLQPRRPGCAW
jgi:GT2 family glycosyltransferase